MVKFYVIVQQGFSCFNDFHSEKEPFAFMMELLHCHILREDRGVTRYPSIPQTYSKQNLNKARPRNYALQLILQQVSRFPGIEKTMQS